MRWNENGRKQGKHCLEKVENGDHRGVTIKERAKHGLGKRRKEKDIVDTNDPQTVKEIKETLIYTF